MPPNLHWSMSEQGDLCLKSNVWLFEKPLTIHVSYYRQSSRPSTYAEFDEAHRTTIEWIIDHVESLISDVENAIVAFYREHPDHEGSAGRKSILSRCHFNGIQVGGFREKVPIEGKFAFSFEVDWDPEHGMEVIVQNYRVEVAQSGVGYW